MNLRADLRIRLANYRKSVRKFWFCKLVLTRVDVRLRFASGLRWFPTHPPDSFFSGLYLTLKLKCYYCDVEDFGNSWTALMDDTACQDQLFKTCFLNQTTLLRKTTQVIQLIRNCDSDSHCACSDVVGWCAVPGCTKELKCCWEDVICDDQ